MVHPDGDTELNVGAADWQCWRRAYSMMVCGVKQKGPNGLEGMEGSAISSILPDYCAILVLQHSIIGEKKVNKR